MQNARDTFYVMLRESLATANPLRTTVVRGLMRAGVLVIENELVTSDQPTDVFCMQWTEAVKDDAGSMPFLTMNCEIHYATAGSEGSAGMDRGRALAAMDMELAGALRARPHSIVKTCYSTLPASTLLTKVFWGEPTFSPVRTLGERLLRTAMVPVFSYQEEGEL